MTDVPQGPVEPAWRTNVVVSAQLALAVVLGVSCCSMAWLLGRGGFGEGAVWILWFVFQAIAAAGLGVFVRPWVALCGAFLIVLAQPVGIWAFTPASEIEHPSRSTGGMAGVCIASMLVVTGSPLVFAAAWCGGRLGRRRQRTRGA